MEDTFNRAADEIEKSGGNMSEDVESIKANFSQLRRDVMDLLGNAFGLGKCSAEYAKDGADAAVDAMKSRLADLKSRGADGVHSLEKRIEDNPLPAALVAFGVGFILAKILTRK